MAQHTNNNHYIPKVLIRRFSNNNKRRYYCEKGIIREKDAKHIFSADNIYDDKLEKAFGLNESKLANLFGEIDEKLTFKPNALMKEITIPEWNVLVYNSKDHAEAVSSLNTFFLRMNLKFSAANTNPNLDEINVARDASTNTTLSNYNSIVFIKYNFNFCPFVLPANIPVILTVGMNLVFVTPLSVDTLMLHYCSENILNSFIKKYRYKHQVNLSMVSLNTPSGTTLCNFVCSDKKYSENLKKQFYNIHFIKRIIP